MKDALLKTAVVLIVLGLIEAAHRIATYLEQRDEEREP